MTALPPDRRSTTSRCVCGLRLALFGVLAGWIVFGVRPAAQAQRLPAKKAANPPLPDGGAGSDADAPAAFDPSRFRRDISQALHFRERAHKQLLDRAAEELKNGRTIDGLRHLQRLLDLPEDRFSWQGNAPEPVGVRQRAEGLLEGLDAAGRETYERLYGFTAKRLAEQAVRDGDPSKLRDVARRFLHTAGGFEAGQRLALLAFERGDFERAVQLWERLLQVPGTRLPADIRLQLAVACRKTGRVRDADRIAQQLGGTLFRIGGRQTTARRFLQRNVPAVVNADWRLPLGSAARNRTASASAPYPQPLWTLDYAAARASAVAETASNWRRGQRSRGRSTAVANTPLVVGQAILLRDFESVKSVDLRTARVNWSHSCSTKLADALTGGGSQTGNGSPFRAVSGESQTEFGRDYAGNSVLHSLTSDGRRVYFVDDVSMPVEERSSRLLFRRGFRRGFRRARPAKPAQAWNRLVAVDLAAMSGDKRLALWKLGGPAGNKKSGPLAGHYFLGPPLPAMGRLYVVSECKLRLQLLCLHPRDGRLLWSQPLAIVDRSVSLDPFRYTRACTPAFANGVLICPTRTGFVTAVDALTGTLKWAAYCGDDPQDLQTAELAFVDRVSKGHSGFRSLPMIHNGRVLYLPAQADHLFCFDLRTGRTLWKQPRDNAEYVAAADDRTAIVVGRRYTRGVSLADGTTRWQTYTGMPSGRGLATASQYLLPLESGRVLSLDRRTGRLSGFGLPGLNAPAPELSENRWRPSPVHRNWQPGNLIAAGDGILSAEANRLRLFPTAQGKLDLAERGLKSAKPTIAALHRAAELAALTGDFDKADRWLEIALRRLKSAPGSDPVRYDAVSRLLRELLFARLEIGTGNPSKLLPRIERLAASPADRGRYLIRKAEFDLLRRDGRSLLKTVDEFCRLDTKRLIATPGRESHLVSAAAWAPAMLERARRTGDAALISLIGRDESQRRRRALQSQGVEPLERYLRIFGTWPQAGAVRNELARRLIDRGDDQQAELLLLADRSSADTAAAAVATQRLFQLWTAYGLHDRAAELLADLNGRFGSVTLAERRTTGRQFARQALRNDMSAVALRRFHGPQSPVRRVSITEVRLAAGDVKTANAYSSFRQLFPTSPESPYDLLDLGDGIQTELLVIHRETGVAAGKIAIPSRHSYPVVSRYGSVGQFMPLGSAGKLHGISLLERRRGEPFWTTRPQGFKHREDMLLVGPAGPTFAVFQARETLLAVDPGTGRLLWQRNDLPESAGLRSDPYSGLFGDERVLTVFDADAARYTTYRTATGDVLRRGRLDVSTRHERRLFGRLLSYVAEERGKTRLRIWDPLTARHIFDREIHPAAYSTTSSDTELLVLAPDGELLVIDVPAGKVRQTSHLEREEVRGITYLKAFRSDGRLFVNVQRPESARDRFFSFYAGDAFGRTEHIRGELYAFDAATGRRLWSRKFPQRTVLLPRSGEFPFLVMVCRIRDRRGGTRAALLVEAVDAETGMTLGRRDNLLPERILHVSFDPRKDAVELRGIQNRIRLKLHHRRVLGPNDDVGL